MLNQPDIAYKIVTVADNSGLAAHTAAVKADTAAVKEQAVAYEMVRDAQGRFVRRIAIRDNSIPTAAAVGGSGASVPMGGYGLASDVAGLGTTEVSAVSQITTEAQYLKAQQLIAKYQELQMAKRLVGVEDTALAGKIAALDAALSTESALTVAQSMEDKALAASKAAATAATEAEAAAAMSAAEEKAMAEYEAASAKEVLKTSTIASKEAIDAETGSMLLNRRGMMEMNVVMREMMSGNISRMPGSISLILQNLRLGQEGAQLIGKTRRELESMASTQNLFGGLTSSGALMRISLIGFAAFEAYRLMSQGIKNIGEADEAWGKILDKQIERLNSEREAKLKSTAANADYVASLEKIRMATADAATQEQNYNRQLEQRVRLSGKIEKSNVGLAEAAIRATEPDAAKREMELFAVRQQEAKFEHEQRNIQAHDEEQSLRTKYQATQFEVERAQKNRDALAPKAQKDAADLKKYQDLGKEIGDLQSKISESEDKISSKGWLASLSPEAVREKAVLATMRDQLQRDLTERARIRLAGGSEERTVVLVAEQNKRLEELNSKLTAATEAFAALNKQEYPGGPTAFQSALQKILDEKAVEDQQFKDSQLAALYSLKETLQTQAHERQSRTGGDPNDPQLQELKRMLDTVTSAIQNALRQPGIGVPKGAQPLQVPLIPVGPPTPVPILQEPKPGDYTDHNAWLNALYAYDRARQAEINAAAAKINELARATNDNARRIGKIQVQVQHNN